MLIELFLLDNLLLNLLIARLASALLSVRPPLFRQTIAALLSAIAAAAAAYKLRWLAHPALRLPLLALISCAQPVKGARGFMHALGATLVSTLLTGGAVLCFSLITGYGAEDGAISGGMSLRAALVSGTLASFLPRAVRRLRARRARNESEVTVVILHRGVIRRFYGIVDTGNTLYEPVSGLPVVVVRCRALAAYAHTPIPIVTAAGKGVLYGFRPERISVGGRGTDCYAAVTGERISAEAIVPPVLLENG